MRDAIVVGAGGGGAVVAKELGECGLDVLVLEAGPFHHDPEDSWSRFANDSGNPVTGYHRFGPGDRSRPWWLREHAQLSLALQVAGVGGTTQHYYGNSPRAMPGSFLDHAGADGQYDPRVFPFPYRELIPYWEWVEATLPVQTAPLGRKEEVFVRGAQAAGLAWNRSKDISADSYRAQENAILQPGGTAGRTDDPRKLRFPQATGCTMCGHCFQGCVLPRGAPRNLKAKRSTDNSYVPMALTASSWSRGGRDVTILADTYVTRVLHEQRRGRTAAIGVEWRDVDGSTHVERSDVVVLAAGAIESPRLWLGSELPNPNGWVGRGLTDHFLDFVVGQVDEDAGGTLGAGSAARADFPGRGSLQTFSAAPALMAVGLLFTQAGGSDRTTAGAWDGATGRLVGVELKEFLSDVNRLVNVGVFTDDDVQADNRVSLSVLPSDEHGPIPRIVMRARQRTRRTLANREWLANRASTMLRAAGVRTVRRIDLAPVLIHLHSTLRMGISEGDSVLDASGGARWVDGLFVADNSALANSLGGPNPTLTTQALATRTAEHIFTTRFGGNQYVRQESPVSSIDDAVTRATMSARRRTRSPRWGQMAS